jgi:hypothetical protein
MTSPDFAATNQNLSLTTQVSTGSINFGSVFINKIDQDGTPSYSSYIGSSLEPLIICQNINVSNTSLDKTGKYLYICGSWNNAFQFYNPVLFGETGSYTLSTRLLQENFLNNGFIVQMNTTDGSCNYVIPISGSDDDFIYKVQYGEKDDSIYVCGFSSSPSCFIYEKQSGLASTFPTNIQIIFNTTSFGSGFLLQFSSSGIFKMKSLLYTDQTLVSVYATDCFVDSERIVVAGKTNASTVDCIDGLNTSVQTLYSSINSVNQRNIFFYVFSLAGGYISSNIVKNPVNLVDVNDIKMYKTYGKIFVTSSIKTILDQGEISVYQKDGSLAFSYGITDIYDWISSIYAFEYDSTVTDTFGNKFSKIVWVNPSPFPFSTNLYQNYKLFVQGYPTDSVLNRNFSIRENYLSDGVYTYLLNEYIDVSKTNRQLQQINGLTGSENYFHSSLSSSSLASTIHIVGVNTGTNTLICDSVSPALIDTNTYYLLFPIDSPSGAVTNKVLITEFYSDSVFTYIKVNNIQDCFVNNQLIGPYVYIGQLNPSVYYNLQFFPSSINTPVYYYFKITSITLPNRPLINVSNKYGGVRGLSDLPYLYMSIYNEDENGNFDDSIVNVVYDNTAVRMKPFPQYVIPLSQTSPTANFVTFTPPLTPIIKFSPNFFRIRFKIMDKYGKVLVFDPAPTKTSDSTFYNNIVPDEYTNVYLRIEAKAI